MNMQSLKQMSPDTGMSMIAMISRLRIAIEQETKCVTANTDFDFKESSERKSRMLFELNRLTRTTDLERLDEMVLSELAKLKRALGKNAQCIEAHLMAVHEVSDLMVSIMKNEEADGTYRELM